MASYAKRTRGWRAQVAIQGVRESKVLSTKAEAVAWATAREAEIRAGKATGIQAGRTVGDAFDRYEKKSQPRSADRDSRRLGSRQSAHGRSTRSHFATCALWMQHPKYSASGATIASTPMRLPVRPSIASSTFYRTSSLPPLKNGSGSQLSRPRTSSARKNPNP